jgi:hypothetical protein
MAESGLPRNRPDDAQRQRRLEALRGLAHDVEGDQTWLRFTLEPRRALAE